MDHLLKGSFGTVSTSASACQKGAAAAVAEAEKEPVEPPTPFGPSTSPWADVNRGNDADDKSLLEDIESMSPEEIDGMMYRVAACQASEMDFFRAADILLVSDRFFYTFVPDLGKLGSSTCHGDAPSGQNGVRRHGVPLRFLATHKEVAWEINGKLQTLIGAAKRTGDPSDVW